MHQIMAAFGAANNRSRRGGIVAWRKMSVSNISENSMMARTLLRNI